MIAKGNQFGLVINGSTNFPACYTKTTAFRDKVSAAIVLLSSSAAALLPLLPFGPSKGGGIDQEVAPATIFGGLRSSYHAFVVSIMFAFSSAFSAMFLHREPQAARIFRFSAIMWLSFAILLLIHAIFCNYLS